MPTSTKQQRAACADLQRVKQGKQPRTLKGMTKSQLEDFCTTPVKKGSKKT